MSFGTKRLIMGLFLIMLLIVGSSSWFSLDLFGGREELIGLIIVAVALIVARVSGMMPDDIRAMKKKRGE